MVTSRKHQRQVFLQQAYLIFYDFRPISSENIGHKLLKKMGWSEGESLGKENTGIQEPVG